MKKLFISRDREIFLVFQLGIFYFAVSLLSGELHIKESSKIELATKGLSPMSDADHAKFDDTIVSDAIFKETLEIKGTRPKMNLYEVKDVNGKFKQMMSVSFAEAEGIVNSQLRNTMSITEGIRNVGTLYYPEYFVSTKK